MIRESGLDTKIEIDGRVSPENVRLYANEYVDIFVAGSTCIHRADIAGSVSALRRLREETLR
jgi:ribulose-phosphate 3-epimerase